MEEFDQISERASLPFRLTIEWARPITGHGTLVAGVVEQGDVRPGDVLELVITGETGQKEIHSVRCITTDVIRKTGRDPAVSPLVGVLVEGADSAEIDVGDLLQAPGSSKWWWES